MTRPDRGLVRPLRLVATLAATASLAGCLIVPVDYTAVSSRHNVDEKTAALLASGSMTREDVVLWLGEPDTISPDERLLEYSWTRVRAIWIVGSYGGAAAGDVEKTTTLRISFGADGRLLSYEIFSTWGGGSSL
jgi:hypothetical protein